MFRKMLVAAVGALLALSVGAAGAYFTAQVQIPDNIIRAGTVALSAEPTSAALSIDGMAPGVTAVRDVAVLNDGTLPIDVVATSAKKGGTTALYQALTCRVSCAGTPLYDGSLAELRTTPLRLAPGAKGDLSFEVGMSSDASDTLEGAYTRLSLYVDAEQAH